MIEKISVVTIYNEADEKFLPGMIKTLPKGLHQIVLVKTVPSEKVFNEYEIVGKEEKGNITLAELHYRPRWDGDLRFDKARNEAKKLATGEYILSLDADERLLIHQHEVIDKLPEVEAYLIGNVSVKFDETVNYVTGGAVRMFRNRPEYIFEGTIHEIVDYSLKRKDVKPIQTSILIHHVGYLDGVNVIQKMRRNIMGMLTDSRTFENEFSRRKLASELRYLSDLIINREVEKCQEAKPVNTQCFKAQTKSHC